MKLPVRILGLYAESVSNSTIVLLGEEGEISRVLPIFIGPAETVSIARGLAGVEGGRPGSHELMLSALEALHTNVRSVTVTELQGGAFHAELALDQAGASYVLDARPSDGLALAVRAGAEVFVEEAVMDEASVAVEHQADSPFDEAEIERIVSDFHDFLDTTEPEDFGV